MPWSQTPVGKAYDPATKHYGHELEFWGGDLDSLKGKLAYVKGLGVDVLYTTPIFQAFTNHKYDTEDYRRIDPQFGELSSFKSLTSAVHRRGMRLVLDGVFNHMGATSTFFKQALKELGSTYRHWFRIDPKYAGGYQGWSGVAGLPVLNTSDRSLADYLWLDRDSVVKHWLREGADGWRLDVAFDLGPSIVSQIRTSAHQAKPGSLVVGEVSGYPSGWQNDLDGVFNFYSLNVGVEMLNGNISGGRAGKMLERAVDDAGIDHLLRSWIHIDNHDTPRAADQLPNQKDRNLAFAMQFTLPGAPVVYYGSELGMTGKGDPECRAPMRWDLVSPSNPTLSFVGHLSRLRRRLPALRIGDFRLLDTDKLLAYLRVTDRALETVMVVVNPLDAKVSETMDFRDGKIMSWGEMQDIEGGRLVRAVTGLVRVEMPPKSVAIFVPVDRRANGYSQYDRSSGYARGHAACGCANLSANAEGDIGSVLWFGRRGVVCPQVRRRQDRALLRTSCRWSDTLVGNA